MNADQPPFERPKPVFPGPKPQRSSLLICACCALTAALLWPTAAFAGQDALVTPGMPGTEDHHLNWPDLDLQWGLGFDLRAPIQLSGPGRGGEVEAQVRAVDLVLRSDFNRDLWGFAMLSGERDQLTLQRLALVYGGLGGTSHLRIGRLPIDFGKQMQARPYELPYPERPAVLQAYLGDQVHATGISYGDVFATSSRSTLRASIGLYSDWDSQRNPMSGTQEGTPESAELALSDQTRLDELALGARVTGVIDVGDEGMFNGVFPRRAYLAIGSQGKARTART